VLLRPTHPQYRALNAYVVGRPYLKLDEVPMFFEAFHGGGPRAREERIWLLQLLGRSLVCDADLVMYKRRHALQLLLSLHDSPLADMPTRRACVHVLLAAAAVPEGAAQLLHEHGLPAWLACTLGQPARAAAAATAGLLPSYAEVLLRLLSSDEAAACLDGAQLVGCVRALECLAMPAAVATATEATMTTSRDESGPGAEAVRLPNMALPNMALPNMDAGASLLVRVLLRLLALPQAAEAVWPHVSTALMHALLLALMGRKGGEEAAGEAAGEAEDEGEDEDEGEASALALALVAAWVEWPLTHPHERGEAEVSRVAALAHLSVTTLRRGALRAAPAHFATPASLVSRLEATASVAAWLARCLSTSAPLCARLSAVDGSERTLLLVRLRQTIGAWSAVVSVEESARAPLALPRALAAMALSFETCAGLLLGSVQS
jgi:hypothetical protein